MSLVHFLEEWIQLYPVLSGSKLRNSQIPVEDQRYTTYVTHCSRTSTLSAFLIKGVRNPRSTLFGAGPAAPRGGFPWRTHKSPCPWKSRSASPPPPPAHACLPSSWGYPPLERFYHIRELAMKRAVNFLFIHVCMYVCNSYIHPIMEQLDHDIIS